MRLAANIERSEPFQAANIERRVANGEQSEKQLTPAARPSSELYPRQQGADEVFDLDLSKLDLSRLDLSALDLSEDELALLLQLRDEQAARGGARDAEAQDELAEWRARRRAEIAEGRVREIDTDEFLELVEGVAAVLIYEEVSPDGTRPVQSHVFGPNLALLWSTAVQRNGMR